MRGRTDSRTATSRPRALPHSDGAFDVVFRFDVLEHVRNLPQVIGEVARVLKTGGVFCYDTLNRTWLSYLVAIKIGQDWPRWAFLPPNLHVWEMFIKPREMEALLRENRLAWKDHRPAGAAPFAVAVTRTEGNSASPSRPTGAGSRS